MHEETFKDEKGTFHYEPVVWGDWKEGDKVVLNQYAGTTVKIDGEELVIVKYNDILAIVE